MIIIIRRILRPNYNSLGRKKVRAIFYRKYVITSAEYVKLDARQKNELFQN